MKDHIHALDETVDKGRIANVAEPHVKLSAELRVQVVDPATGPVRRVHAEGADVGTVLEKAFHQMAANESVTSRDQHATALEIHSSKPSSPRTRRRSAGRPTSFQPAPTGWVCTYSPRAKQASTSCVIR